MYVNWNHNFSFHYHFNPMLSLLLPLAPMKNSLYHVKKERKTGKFYGWLLLENNFLSNILYESQDENTQKNLSVEK